MSLALCFILCVALGACGDLPRPFQPADKSTQAWSTPGDIAWGSILVPPIGGLPVDLSRALVDEVVEALQLRDVPASAHAGGRGSILLAGHVSVAASKLRWSLIAPDGETALRFEEPRLDASSIGTAAADLEAIAARAAGRVAAVLKPPAAEVPGLRPQVPLVIETVRGAPGDGGIALARAMRHSLARIGVTVVDAPEDGVLTIQGWVSVAREDTATDSPTVTIAWDVLHPDGTRLGTITQSNRVGADQLTGTWGVLPQLVARAGAPGIAQLLGQPKVRQVAEASQRKAPAEPPTRTLIEAPLTLLVEASAAPLAVLVEASAAPLAVLVEASAAPLVVLVEAPLMPLARPQPEPHLKPDPEVPAAPSVLVEAPIAVSVTVR